MALFDVDAFRQHFPFFSAQPEWVYLDNAATSHKPQQVIDAVHNFYQQLNSNVHRSAHSLSNAATARFEHARQSVYQFLGANPDYQVIWTSGCTAGFNLVAFGLMHSVLQPGDRILITSLEHHANIVPWQFHVAPQGVIIDVVPCLADGQLDEAEFQRLLSLNPKVVSMTQASNGLGQQLPLDRLLTAAKACGAITVVDGAQGILALDPVPDCDLYLWSGHKLYGPTGIGVLYGRSRVLEMLRPLHYGGEMISHVSFSHTTLNQLPYRLEAGTPAIASAIGLGAAVDFIQQFDAKAMRAHKQQRLQQLADGLTALPQVQLLSNTQHNIGILTLNVAEQHPSDIALLLDQRQIAVRAGRHCAMPLFAALNQVGALRFSVAAYTTAHDIDRAIEAMQQILRCHSPQANDLASAITKPVETTSVSPCAAVVVMSPASEQGNATGLTRTVAAYQHELDQVCAHWWQRIHEAAQQQRQLGSALYPELMKFGKHIQQVAQGDGGWQATQPAIQGCDSPAWLVHHAQGWLFYSDVRLINALMALLLWQLPTPVLTAVPTLHGANHSNPAEQRCAVDELQQQLQQRRAQLMAVGLLTQLSQSRQHGMLAILAELERQIGRAR
jgi:cysteine sulfinate desulfinase/cysteine desulfurase/selenocysteine lyase